MTTDKPRKSAAGWNVESIVNHFGDAANLARLAARHGLAISHEAVRKWKQRSTIPAPKLAELVELGARIGKPLVLARHVVAPSTISQGAKA